MSDEVEPDPGGDGPVCYRIRVRGELGTVWSDWFSGLRVTAESGETLLTGRMDQATLHAALRRVRDLGLTLVSVTQVEDR